MATTVEDLKREKEMATSVAYQKFILLINTNPDSLFCFFENKDAPYYHLSIKTSYNGDFHYISCGNKSMVKKAHDLIKSHEEFDNYKLAFIVDRDFDESIKNKFADIYETPCYSIENLYCQSSSIKELIKTDFQIGEDDPLHKTIVELYKNLQSDFLNASLLFNAWYKLQKKKSIELNQKLDICLTDTLIPTFVELTLQVINQKYTIDRILEKFPNPAFGLIFTTAYSEYAFDAFQFNALHYMLKPYSISEIRKTVTKIKEFRPKNEIVEFKPKITIFQQPDLVTIFYQDILLRY